MDNIRKDSEATLFFKKDDKLERITFVRDEDCENERDFCEPLSTIIWNTGNRHHVGGSKDEILRDMAADWEDYFYKQNYNAFQDMSQEEYDKLTLEDMKNMWAETKFVCLPLNYKEHSSALPIILYTQDEKEFSNDGYIFVERNNEEVKDYLKGHTEEETKNWAKGIIESEIEAYNMYLQGEVYGMIHEVYNEETKEFEKGDSLWGIYINDIYKGEESKDVMEVIEGNTHLDKDSIITEEQAAEFQTDNYRLNKQFFSEANNLLPDFENNPVMAFRATAKIWDRTRHEDLKAVNDYLEKNSSSESDFKYLLFKNMDVSVNHGNFANIALQILGPEDVDNWCSDLYLRKNEKTDLLFERFKDDELPMDVLKKTGTVSVFRDEIEHVPYYEFKSILPLHFEQANNIHKCTKDEFERVKYFGTEEEKINKMFDSIYTKEAFSRTDWKDMDDYIKSRVIPAGACYEKATGEKWWKLACEHALTSGGNFWLDNTEMQKAMIKVGLEKPTILDTSRMSDEQYEIIYEETPKKYTNYFFKYLKQNKYIDPQISPNMEKKNNLGIEGR